MAKRTEQQLLEDIAKPAAIKDLNSRIDTHFEVLASKYPKHEKDTWPTQVAEAEKVLEDSSIPVEHIDAACLECGLDKVELATIILGNAQAYESTSGHLVGLRIKYKNMVKACTSLAQLQAVRG